MASNTPPRPAVRAIFFRRRNAFFAHFWVHFLATFWPSFGPPLGVSLGVSWEPSRASWSSLGKPLDPKTLKNWKFFKVFENAAFWLFEAPDGSLGLILPPLWPIWSQSGPQNGSQKWSKKWSNSWSKMTPKVIKNDTKKLVQRGFQFLKNRSDRTLFSEIGPSKNAYLKMP